ncbi:Biotin carboxyl carrier protein of acetyl-CoA carboxylase [Caloramator mitchellensis]|uniref:Biotin carboxyl carrier protein of acetyl-CoA carboxylase n=1 Tax=Caloramator mitchellensis TaxID=908809 RepID=A0A0R3K2S5_CALMK|nr:acetyl-CoA carboxylase biotin carboxyl carrier protein [Caloramator mitchellensis]KRQ87870.1 Biotin carboxyl carrier protein of acetyl-CoA carboxylase [Caloramator mitchellensis]
MDINEIKELIQSVDKSSLTSLEIISKDMTIVMKKEIMYQSVENLPKTTIQYVDVKSDENIIKEEKKEVSTANLHTIKAPLVGVFYRSPGPNLNPFVEVGTKVKKGDTLCIIEAMKIMNEIQCDVDGEIVEILVQNESMVEFGQELFRIKV